MRNSLKMREALREKDPRIAALSARVAQLESLREETSALKAALPARHADKALPVTHRGAVANQ